MYAFGGKSMGDRKEPLEALSACYESRDNGRTWKVNQEAFCLPKEFVGREEAFSAATDGEYVWVMWSKSGAEKEYGEILELIADDEELSRKFGEWIEKQINYKLSIFASYHNRYLNAAANRGYIPRPILKQELLGLINHINCEAHRDTTIGALTSIIKAK
jgi:hypothetical protein